MSKGSVIKRERKDGGASYRLKWELPRGGDNKRKTATKTLPAGTTKKQAEAELRRLLLSVDTGSYVAPTKATVAEFLESWREGRRARGQISATTAERQGDLLRRQTSHIASMPLQKVTPSDIQKVLDDASKTLAPSTVRLLHGTLSTAFNVAVRDGLVTRSPCVNRDLPKQKSRPMRALDVDEMQSLLKALEGHALYPLVRVSLGTGARRSEALALRWGDVDLDRAVIHIKRSLESSRDGGLVERSGGKTDSAVRSVPITAGLVEFLRGYRRECAEAALRFGVREDFERDSLVFPKSHAEPQQLQRPDRVSSAFHDAVGRHGFAGLRLHDLRHTYASVLLGSGGDLASVSRRLGHANLSITLGIYTHLIRSADERTNEIAARVGL